jgi:hypothetical protein
MVNCGFLVGVAFSRLTTVSRRGLLYNSLFGLTRNPFPDASIATALAASPFDPFLHPDVPLQLAEVFLGAARRSPNISLLWSLGYGEGARGFGKTSYLQWFAGQIRHDFGESLLRLSGRKAERLLAAYCSFSTLENLSLSNVLFDACEDLLLRHPEPLCTLREEYAGSTDELLFQARAVAERAYAGYRFELLWRLSYQPPGSWRDYLGQLGSWHKVRWGRQVFASVFSAMRVLGVRRFLLCIDQVEDFADWDTPSYKLVRDVQRLSCLHSEDQLFAGKLHLVLTMHPRAQRVLHSHWNPNTLGALSHDHERCVLLNPLNLHQLERLATLYLNTARNDGIRGTRPFTRGVLKKILSVAAGKPGECLRLLHQLLELGVDHRVPIIDEELCHEFFAGDELRPSA